MYLFNKIPYCTIDDVAKEIRGSQSQFHSPAPHAWSKDTGAQSWSSEAMRGYIRFLLLPLFEDHSWPFRALHTRQKSRDHATQQCLSSEGRHSCAHRRQFRMNLQHLPQKVVFEKIAFNARHFCPWTCTFLTKFWHARDCAGARPFHLVYPNETPKSAFSALYLADSGSPPFLSRSYDTSELYLLI